MAKKKEVIITCNATNVKAVIEGLERGMAALAREEERLLNVIKQRGYAENDEKKRLKELEKAMDAMRTNVQKNKDEQKKLAEVMKDLAGAKLKDLKKALQEGKNALNNMSARDPKRAQLVNDLKKIQAQIDANTGATKRLTGAQKGFSSAIASTAKNLATYMIGFAGFNKVKGLVEGVFRSNLKLSDSLANIRKVSGLSSEAINDLYRNISKIDSRNTIETLNQLAYTGAKLGIGQNYGVKGLTGFVKAAEQVQMALGEDMGEKALPDLSKMIEVMGLIDKYGVEQSMQKAASAIFQLGATSTATGTNIVEFSKRLYGLANVSRISTQDLLGLASASDAMGLMPEVSATAFNKLFTSIQRQHNLIEQSLGMTKGRIKELYEEGKTMDAIVEIFERMNAKGNLNLLGDIFKDLGSDGARLVNVMATMADRADILRKHLQTSRDAFKEGEAVIGEYMIQNQTAAALVERANNLWSKAFTNPEGVDMVKEMAQAWYDLSKQMTQSDALMGSLRTSINAIATAIGVLIKLFPVLIRFAMVFGAAFGLKAAIAGVGALITAFRTLYKDIVLATGAVGKFNKALKSNVVLLVITALVTAISLVIDYTKAADEAAKREQERQAKLKAAFEASKEAVQNIVKPLETYKKALDDASLSEQQRMEMVKQFKNDYQDYLDYLGIEIESAVDLAKAYAQVVKVMKQKKAYEERESFREQQNGENRMSRIEAQAQVEAKARSLGIEGIDKEYLKGTQNVNRNGYNVRLGTDEVVLNILKKKYGDNIGISSRGQVYRIETVDKRRPASGRNQRANIIDVDVSGLRDAVTDYIRSYRTETETNKQIDQMFNSEYKDIDLEHFDIDEYNDRVQRARWRRKGSLDNEKPDKAAQKAARAAAAAARKELAERKQALRKELQDAETESQAIIDKIEEFYRLQESVVEGAVADGKLARADADMYLKKLKISKNEVLADVRGALTGDKEFSAEDWKKYVEENLKPVMADQGKWSSELLGEIINTSLSDLHKTLNRFNGSNTFGITSTAFFDKISKGRAGNIREVNRIKAEITEEVNKMLSEYHYVEQAGKSFHDRLVALGIMTETYEEYVKRMQQEAAAAKNKGGENKETLDEDIWKMYDLPDVPIMGKRPPTPEEKMRSKFLSNISDAYLTNPDDEQQVLGWLKRLITTQYDESVDDWQINMEDWAEKIPHLTEWIKDFANHKSDIQLFYLDLIQWEGEYYDALKKRDELQNKRLDSWWEHSDKKKENDKQLRNIQLYDFQYNTLKKGQDMGYMAGLTDDVNKDPEVLREQAILEAKMAIWEQAKKEREKGLISEEVYQQRMQEMQDQTIAYTQKIMANIQKRIDRLHQFEKPVTDMANNVGKKLGEMIIGAEEESMTWKEIWKSMALAVADSVIDMSAQYAQNLIVEKAMNAQSKQEAISKATVDVAAGTASGAAKTVGQLGWWGLALIPVIAALLHGLLAAVFSSNKSSDSTSSSSGVKTKLVSGMLTYDKGNVKRFIGQDGKVYTATEEPQPRDGLVTHPIATTVQGQPALVAEKGPEIVVGRETTKAIMMNEPQLIKYLANYEKHGGRGYMPYDSGNIADVASSLADNGLQDDNDSMRRQMQQMQEVMEQVLYYLQNPVAPEIAMYDTGGKKGLRSKMKEADRFMARYGG